MDFEVNRYRQVTGVAVASMCLVWLSFALRGYCRLAVLKFMAREDYLTIFAMIIFTSFTALCLELTSYGLGAHMDHIPHRQLVKGFMIAFACELLYVVTSAVTKWSVATYFRRLSSKPYQRIIISANLILVVIVSITYLFFLIFQCKPIEYSWRQYRTHPTNGTCLSRPTIFGITYAHAATSAVTDWVFGVLPFTFVWDFDMNCKTKLSVVLILSLGFFASSATIVRIFYIQQLGLTTDWSWEGIHITKWSMVEPAIAITAMNIATLRPMFAKFIYFKSKSMKTALDWDSEEDKLVNGASHKKGMADNCGRATEFNQNFADLLGLQRKGAMITGVKTTISASGNKIRRFSIKKSGAHAESGHRAVQREWTGINHTNVVPRLTSRPPTDGIEVRTDIYYER